MFRTSHCVLARCEKAVVLCASYLLTRVLSCVVLEFFTAVPISYRGMCSGGLAEVSADAALASLD